MKEARRKAVVKNQKVASGRRVRKGEMLLEGRQGGGAAEKRRNDFLREIW